jgi:hypothetical protein
LTHTFCEAYLPYTSYRGLPAGESPRRWLPLDASFKQKEFTAPLLMNTDSGIDPLDYANEFAQSMDFSDDYSTLNSFSAQALEEYESEYQSWVQQFISQYVDSHGKEKAMDDLIGSQGIIGVGPGLLSSSLPYDTYCIHNERSTLSDQVRYRLSLNYEGINVNGRSPLITMSSIEMVGKRTTLSYRAATEQDRSIIMQYDRISDVPAYLVYVMPVIRVDDTPYQAECVTRLGNLDRLIADICYPTGHSQVVNFSVVAGGYDTLCLDLGGLSTEEIESHAGIMRSEAYAFEQVLGGTATSDYIYPDRLMGEFFNLTGMLYLTAVKSSEIVFAQTLNIQSIPEISLLRAGLKTSNDLVLGIPISLNMEGEYIDVGVHSITAVSRSNDDDAVAAFMIIMGVTSSSSEAMVWSKVFGDDSSHSVSATTLFRDAFASRIPISIVDSTNISDVLPLLDIGNDIRGRIASEVNNDHVVLVPQNKVQIAGWEGTGYISLDPRTLSYGYYIAGNIRGGEHWEPPESVSFVTICDFLIALLASLYPVPTDWVSSLMAVSSGAVFLNSYDSVMEEINYGITMYGETETEFIILSMLTWYAIARVSLTGGPGLAPIIAWAIALFYDKKVCPLYKEMIRQAKKSRGLTE